MKFFLTNSLFGIIPVNNLEKKVFKSKEISKEILNKYRRDYEKKFLLQVLTHLVEKK